MIGRKIVGVRLMSDKEEEESFGNPGGEKSAVLELDNGEILYASQDYEGNGSGAIFGTSKDKKKFFVVYPGGKDE